MKDRLFGTMKSVLFKPEAEEQPPDAAPPLRTTKLGTTRRTASTFQNSTARTFTTSGPDEEFSKEIAAALATGRLPGYNEFNAQCDALAGAIPDETTRVAAAIATVTNILKLSKEQLIASVKERIDLVEQHKRTFDANLQTDLQKNQKAGQQQIETIQANLARNEAEQARLAAENDSLQAKLRETERELGDVEAEAGDVSRRYDGAYQAHIGTLEAALHKLMGVR